MTQQVDIVETQGHKAHGLVLIDAKGAVWRTFYKPWWSLADWFWWWLHPGAKKWLIVKREDRKIRVRAVRIARTYAHIGKP